MRDMFSSEASKRFKSSWQTTSEQVVTPASPFRAAIHKDNELKARDGGLIKVIMIACRQLGGAIAMEQADEPARATRATSRGVADIGVCNLK